MSFSHMEFKVISCDYTWTCKIYCIVYTVCHMSVYIYITSECICASKACS